MKLDWGAWLYGVVSGFIGGGAGSIGAAFGGMATDFEHFNPGSGLHHLLTLMGTTFLFSGIITAAAYLAKSPLPQPEGPRAIWTDEQRAAAKK